MFQIDSFEACVCNEYNCLDFESTTSDYYYYYYSTNSFGPDPLGSSAQPIYNFNLTDLLVFVLSFMFFVSQYSGLLVPRVVLVNVLSYRSGSEIAV